MEHFLYRHEQLSRDLRRFPSQTSPADRQEMARHDAAREAEIAQRWESILTYVISEARRRGWSRPFPVAVLVGLQGPLQVGHCPGSSKRWPEQESILRSWVGRFHICMDASTSVHRQERGNFPGDCPVYHFYSPLSMA